MIFFFCDLLVIFNCICELASKQITMLHSVCCYGGNVYMSGWIPEKQSISVIVYQLDSSGHTSAPRLKRVQEWPIFLPVAHGSGDYSVKHGVECVVDVISGLRESHLVVGIRDRSQFIVMVHRISTKGLIQVVCDIIDYAISTVPHFKHIYLFDGPLLIILQGNKLHVTVCDSIAKAQHVKIEQMSAIKRILFVKSVFPFILNEEEVLHAWLIVMSCEDGSESDQRSLCIGFIVRNFISKRFQEQFYAVPNKCFLYQSYVPITTSVKIQLGPYKKEASESSNCFEDAIRVTKNSWVMRNTTVICTEKKQFVVFIQGSLKYCCSIPFPDVKTMYRVASAQGVYFVLPSSLKGTSMVKKERDSVCVYHTWDDPVHSLAINNGEAQHLVLFLSIPEQRKPLLPDYSVVNLNAPVLAMEDVSECMNPEKNAAIEAAERGLRQRLIAGEAALSDMKKRIREKDRFIERMQTTMHDMSLGKETAALVEVPELVDVIPGSRETRVEQHAQSYGNSALPEHDLEINEQWVAIWDQNLIFGKTLRNNGSVEMLDIREAFYISKQDLHQAGKTFYPKNQALPNTLCPSESCSVVIMLEIPVSAKDVLEFTSLLFWNIKPENPNATNKLPAQYKSATFTIPVADIFTNNIKPVFELPMHQQIPSLRVFQSSRQLAIRSSQADISDITTILSLPNLKNPPLLTSYQGTEMIVFANNASPLSGVNLNLLEKRTDRVEIVAYFRDDCQYKLLLHWLYSSLPHEVVITQGSLEERVNNILESLKEEVDFVHSSLTGFSKQGQSSCNCSKKDRIILPADQYKRFRDCLASKEIKTDNYVQELFQ